MSSTDGDGFFKKESSVETLRYFSKTLRSVDDAFPESAWLLNALRGIVALMIQMPKLFDEYCEYNIGQIGKVFMDKVSNFSANSVEGGISEIKYIFSLALRFLYELEFMRPEGAYEYASDIFFAIDKKLDSLDGEEKRQIVFAQQSMPIYIVKSYLINPSFGNFRDFPKNIERASRLMLKWNDEFEEKKNYIEGIREQLRNATSSFNFVGLVQGFQNLSKSKSWERRIALASLIILAVCMIGLPCYQVWYVRENINLIEKNKWVLLYSLPGLLAIEFVLIYFFRVVLSQFRSVKAQILQIELRKTLCQFIESYTEYSMKIKEKDSDALAKFEALVFSGLAPDNESIPSTFDGVEQLANLFKSIRG